MGVSLGDRMKANYEHRTRHYLTRRCPVIIRLDGRAFHSFTRGMNKPFDKNLMMAMCQSAASVAKDAQGFKAAYIQSDEVSLLLTDYDDITTEAWFDYNQSKIESVSASLITGYFNQYIQTARPAAFDARAFNIPSEEISNYFLWRAKDWERNSVSMYCQSFFSHKQLHSKCRQEQHDLLHSIGKNWTTDLSNHEKNGMFIDRIGAAHVDIGPSFLEVNNFIQKQLVTNVDIK